MLNCKELGQRAVDLISDDFFVGDEDVFEDGLVELATDFVACAHVEGMGVFKQSQVGLEELGPLAEVISDSGEFGPELVALASDVREAGTDLALRKGAIRCEVEEVFLFRDAAARRVNAGKISAETIVGQDADALERFARVSGDASAGVRNDIAPARLDELRDQAVEVFANDQLRSKVSGQKASPVDAMSRL